MSELSKALNEAREIIGAIEGMALWSRHPEMRCNLSISGEPCSSRYNVNFDVSWSAGVYNHIGKREYVNAVGKNAVNAVGKLDTSESYEAWCRALNEESLKRDVMQMRAERLNEATDAAKDREWSTLLRDGYVSTSSGADYDVDAK